MIPKQLHKLKFCRIKRGTKKPFEKDWTNKPYSYDEIIKFLPKENYGVLCGYKDLAVIDTDNEAMQVAVENMFPKTFRIKTPNGVHNYFYIPDLKQKIILETNETHLGEIQSHGTQVVGPGSIHPSKKKYEVLIDEKITKISCEEIYDKLKPFIKSIRETEKNVEWERKEHSEIDELSVANIWGITGLKKHNDEYYGIHPTHGSEGGMNFWINPSKNLWHCFRHDTGGGVLSAIAVKEGIIDCSEARKGNLRGDKAIQCIKKAREKYGLKDDYEKRKQERELRILAKRFGGELKSEEEGKFRFIWDKDLKDYKEEKTDWIVEKFIKPKSINILAGKRSTVKSWIGLNMGLCIACGLDFLEKFKCLKSKVMYLDRENGFSELKLRSIMEKRGLEIKEAAMVFISESFVKLDRRGDLTVLEEFINENEIKFMIVDTYRRLISFKENEADAVSEFFVDKLKPLCERTGIAILLIHHERKGESTGDEMDMLRGSSDLANYVDSIIQVKRRGNFLTIRQTKQRGAKELEPFELKIETDELTYFKFIYKGEKLNQEKVIEKELVKWFLETRKRDFTYTEAMNFCKDSGFKKNKINDAILNLQNKGIIIKGEGYKDPYSIATNLNLEVFY